MTLYVHNSSDTKQLNAGTSLDVTGADLFDTHLAICVIALTVVRRVISFLRRSTKMGIHSGSFSVRESPMEATT